MLWMTEVSTSFAGVADHNNNITYNVADPVLAAFLSVYSIVGFLGNLLMIVTIATMPQFWTVAHFHILLRAINDLAVSCLIMSFQAYTVYVGHGPSGCGFVGTLELFTGVLSAAYLSAVALNRYLIVRLSADMYHKVYSKRNMVLMILGLVLISFTAIIPILTGYVSPGYDEHAYLCSSVASSPTITYDAVDNLYILTLLYVCLYGVPPCVIVAASYSGVWWTFRKSSKAILQNSSTTNSNHRKLAQIRLTRNLVILTLAYAICWMPILVVNLLDTRERVPKVAYTVSTMLCYTHCIMYPWLCALLLKPYRNGYWLVLSCRCRNSLTQISPSDSAA